MTLTARDHPVVVTGAASGIGAALARELRSQGRRVIGLDLREGDDILACDLADPGAVATVARDLLPARLGGLANVAGVPGTAPAHTVLAVNVLAPRLLATALQDRFVAGSAIVNVASVAAHRNTQPAHALDELERVSDLDELRTWLATYPIDGPAAYDTSKRVLVDWSSRYAAELMGTGRRCVSVSPGPVETPILADFATSMGQDALDRSAAMVGRHGRSDEVAAVVAFVLSPQASWLNGIDIPVEGGLFAVRRAEQARAQRTI